MRQLDRSWRIEQPGFRSDQKLKNKIKNKNICFKKLIKKPLNSGVSKFLSEFALNIFFLQISFKMHFNNFFEYVEFKNIIFEDVEFKNIIFEDVEFKKYNFRRCRI